MYTIWYIVVICILFCGLNLVLPMTCLDHEGLLTVNAKRVSRAARQSKSMMYLTRIKKNYHQQNGPHPVTKMSIKYEEGDTFLIACHSSDNLLLQVEYYGIDLIETNNSKTSDSEKSLEISLPLDKYDDGLNASCTTTYRGDDNPTTQRIQFELVKRFEIPTSIDKLYTTEGQFLPISCKGKAILHKDHDNPKVLKTENGRILEPITMVHNGTVLRCFYFDDNNYTYENTGQFDVTKQSWMIIFDLKYKTFDDFMKEFNDSPSLYFINLHILALYASIAVILCLNMGTILVSWKRKSRQTSVGERSCENLKDHCDDEEITNHPYEVIEEFTSVHNVSADKTANKPPRPLPSDEENKPYIHYDTPYEERFSRMAAMLLGPKTRNQRLTMQPHVNGPRGQPI